MELKIGDLIKVISGPYKGTIGHLTTIIKKDIVGGYWVEISNNGKKDVFPLLCVEKIEEPNPINCTITGNSVSQWEVPQKQYTPSRRDYFACKIINATIIQHITSLGINSPTVDIDPSIVEFTDALIAELDKTEKK